MATMLDILWIERVLTSECPMIIRNWVLPLTTSLLALSLPLLVGQIHRVDDRFGKKGVGTIFAHTNPIKAYFICLGVNLLFIILYFLKIPRYGEWGKDLNVIIDHSAEILTILASFAFLGSVLWVIWALLHIATNTEKMYEAFHTCLNEYFEK